MLRSLEQQFSLSEPVLVQGPVVFHRPIFHLVDLQCYFNTFSFTWSTFIVILTPFLSDCCLATTGAGASNHTRFEGFRPRYYVVLRSKSARFRIELTPISAYWVCLQS